MLLSALPSETQHLLRQAGVWCVSTEEPTGFLQLEHSLTSTLIVAEDRRWQLRGDRCSRGDALPCKTHSKGDKNPRQATVSCKSDQSGGEGEPRLL